MGGLTEERIASEWTHDGRGAEDFSAHRERVREQAREDEEKAKAAVAVQARVRGMKAREAYLEKHPPKQWRFVKMHRRVVVVGAGAPSAHSGTTIFYVEKHERLDLTAAVGSGRLMLEATGPQGELIVRGSCVYDSSLHALVAASGGTGANGSAAGSGAGSNGSDGGGGGAGGGLAGVSGGKRRNSKEGTHLAPPICSAPGEHVYHFTVEPLTPGGDARLELTFQMESVFGEADLLSEPPREQPPQAKSSKGESGVEDGAPTAEAPAVAPPPMSAMERRRAELAGLPVPAQPTAAPAAAAPLYYVHGGAGGLPVDAAAMPYEDGAERRPTMRARARWSGSSSKPMPKRRRRTSHSSTSGSSSSCKRLAPCRPRARRRRRSAQGRNEAGTARSSSSRRRQQRSSSSSSNSSSSSSSSSNSMRAIPAMRTAELRSIPLGGTSSRTSCMQPSTPSTRSTTISSRWPRRPQRRVRVPRLHRQWVPSRADRREEASRPVLGACVGEGRPMCTRRRTRGTEEVKD